MIHDNRISEAGKNGKMDGNQNTDDSGHKTQLLRHWETAAVSEFTLATINDDHHDYCNHHH